MKRNKFGLVMIGGTIFCESILGHQHQPHIELSEPSQPIIKTSHMEYEVSSSASFSVSPMWVK